MLLWSIWLGSKDTTKDHSKFTEEGRLRNWQCLAYYEKNLKGRVPENKEKRLRFLWLVAVFNQKNNFSWWGEWLIDANLIRVKKHQQRPIKIYLEEKTQLVQKLLFVITIIILMKQKLYHQYISGKKKKENYLTWNEQCAFNYPCKYNLEVCPTKKWFFLPSNSTWKLVSENWLVSYAVLNSNVVTWTNNFWGVLVSSFFTTMQPM